MSDLLIQDELVALEEVGTADPSPSASLRVRNDNQKSNDNRKGKDKDNRRSFDSVGHKERDQLRSG